MISIGFAPKAMGTREILKLRFVISIVQTSCIQDPELLRERAYTFASLGMAPQALADLEFVKHFEELDDYSKQAHDWAVKQLAK